MECYKQVLGVPSDIQMYIYMNMYKIIVIYLSCGMLQTGAWCIISYMVESIFNLE